MDDAMIYRRYKMKSYLNASHYISINGKKGEIHPHTWEFCLDMRFPKNDFNEFTIYTKQINEFFDQYQDRLLNEVEPFCKIIPTLENITDYFTEELNKIVAEMNGILDEVAGSETPTICYITSPVANKTDAFFLSKCKESFIEGRVEVTLRTGEKDKQKHLY